MNKILTFILIMATIGCDNSTKFVDGKFYNGLNDCEKKALRLYNRFEKISLENYEKDNSPFVEKGSQVFNLVDMLNQDKKNRPVIFYFTSHACRNCEFLEEQIFNQAEIQKRLRNEFLIIPLTVDGRVFLQDDKQIVLSEDCIYYGSKKEMKRIGAVHVNLQGYFKRGGTQPFFYAFDANSELGIEGNMNSADEFNAFLDKLK